VILSSLADPINGSLLPQIFTVNADFYLKAIRVRLISFGNPSFTQLKAVLKTVRGSVVLDTFADSENILIRSDISAESLNEVHFDFKSHFLRQNEKFAVALEATGYTPNDNSHLALVRAWPNQVYGPLQSSAFLTPGYFGFIGGKK
jgi:hypothetical protein